MSDIMLDDFVTDLNVILPPELQADAALAAIRERVSNAPAPDDPTKYALGVARNRLWRIGRTLRIYFLDDSLYPVGRVAQVMEAANEWTKYANLKFELSNDPTSELRVSFNPKDGCWSNIGTDALVIPQSKPTINLSVMGEIAVRGDYRKYILHEFGHAIGCIHEHQLPNARIQWNRDAVYQHYKQYGWSEAQVNFNVLDVFDTPSSNLEYHRDVIASKAPIISQNSETFDPDSIMIYAIPKKLTKNGYEVKWRDVLSEQDKRFIATVYPKEK